MALTETECSNKYPFACYWIKKNTITHDKNKTVFSKSENNIIIPPRKNIFDNRGIDPFFQKNKNTSQIKTRSQLLYITKEKKKVF